MDYACAACGHDRAAPAYAVRDLVFGASGAWDFVTCGSCGHGQLHPRPSDEELGALYAGLYTPDNLRAMDAIGRSGFERRLHRRRLAAIAAALGGRPVRRLVDVGCGLGFFLADLARAHPQAEAVGVELAPQAALVAASRPGVTVLRAAFEEADLGEVDLLTLNHVLEHLAAPEDAVARAAEVVAPGGVFEVEVPRLDGWGRRWFGRWYWGHLPPQHLQLFRADGLTRLLERHGFEVASTHTSSYPLLATTTLVLAVRYTVGSRSPHARNWLVRGPVVLAGLSVLPAVLLFDLLAGPLLGWLGHGDILTVVARRR